METLILGPVPSDKSKFDSSYILGMTSQNEWMDRDRVLDGYSAQGDGCTSEQSSQVEP